MLHQSRYLSIPTHYHSEQARVETEVLGHSLVRLLAPLTHCRVRVKVSMSQNDLLL